MIGLDRTPGVLTALPASNFPWPMGDESAPLSSSPAMARHSAKPDASSPQRHSSLTPAPDSSSPNAKPETTKSPENSNEDASNAGLVDDGGAPSPLSELSPAPEEDDEDDGQDTKDAGGDSKKDEGKPAGASNTPPRVNGISKKPQAPNAVASSSHSPLRGSYPPHQADQSANLLHPGAASAKRNRKIDVLIQLNAELFKALEEFHSRSVPKDDPRLREFSSRLQMNLGWLANAADNPQALVGMNSLPPLTTPQPIDFLPMMDRILQLYKELGALFGRDMARIRENAQHPPGQGSGMGPGPGSLKRERPEHATPEPMNKRRDTGEHKTPMLPPSTPATMGRGFPPGVGGVAPSTPQMAASSPSIPSQGFPPMNPTQAEMQRRAAQLSMRNQQAVPQRPTQTSPSQMQPPPVPGPSAINMANPQVQAVVAQFGQNGMRALHVLQNPNSPIIQQVIKNVSTFQSMSLIQQVSTLLRYTGAIDRERQHQLQQQQQQQQQQGGGGGMPMQGGPGGMPLNRMGSGGLPGAPMGVPSQGGPGGISIPPGGFTQQQIMQMPQQQRQMLMMQQQQMRSSQGGGGGMQGGINPAAFGAGAGGPGGMQGGINPAVFGGQGGQGGVNPQMLQQQQQRMMQQQAAQQQQQHQGGAMSSPIHAGSPANEFPGMQRSTHSPSENAPSPMTPRGGPGGAGSVDFQRMMAMQAAQANAPSPAPSNTGGGGFINPQQMMAGGGGGQGAGWSQPSSGSAGPYGGTPPGSAHGRSQQQFPPSAPSPGAGGWPGSAGGSAGGGNGGSAGGYPYAPSPVHQMGGPQHQQRPPSRTASAAGGGFPGMDPSSSPGLGGGMDAGLGDFSEFFNTQGWS